MMKVTLLVLAIAACTTEQPTVTTVSAETRYICREAATCAGRVLQNEQIADGVVARDRARNAMLAVCNAYQGQLDAPLFPTSAECPAAWSCDVLCVPAFDEEQP